MTYLSVEVLISLNDFMRGKFKEDSSFSPWAMEPGKVDCHNSEELRNEGDNLQSPTDCKFYNPKVDYITLFPEVTSSLNIYCQRNYHYLFVALINGCNYSQAIGSITFIDSCIMRYYPSELLFRFF